MSSIFEDDVDAIYAEAAELMPHVVAIGGVDYQCWPARPSAELMPTLEGDPSVISVQLKVKKSAFTTPPAEGIRAKYKTKSYRIARVQESADGLQLTLSLESPAK